MAKYALQFASFTDFTNSLANTTTDGAIGKLMNTQPRSGAYSVAITAHIYSTGETYSCGTNIIMDIKSAGPGDYVVYKDSKFFTAAQKWIDNNRPSQPTQKIMAVNEGWLTTAGFTICGTVVRRFGNRIRLAGARADLPWTTTDQSDYAWDVPTIGKFTSVRKKDGNNTNTFNSNAWCAFPSLRYQEAYFSTGDATYLPITRATWNAAVVAGETTVTQNGKTATLADFDYDYDKWLRVCWAPMFPAPDGAYSENDPKGNTLKIVTAFLGKTDKNGATITKDSVSFAAGYCYNYAITGVPGLGKHQWFLGALKGVGEIRALTHTLRSPIAWRNGYLWSSTQSSQYGSWFVGYNGLVPGNYKYLEFPVVPLADLILES